AERRGDGAGELAAADLARREERAEDLVAPSERGVGMPQGVVHGRRLRQPREQRGLGQRERLRALGEERLRRRLRSVRGAPVEDLVDVVGEDLLLRPDPGDLLGEARLLDLAGERPPGLADVEIPDELLRDRRAALDDAAGRYVLVQRTRDAAIVEG